MSKYAFKRVNLTVAQEAKLIGLAKRGSRKAEAFLVKNNLPFVIRSAQQYLKVGYPLNDLVQAGSIGLLRGIRDFDESRGIKLCSFAVWWILASFQKEIQLNSCHIRIPANYHSKALKDKKKGIESEIAEIYDACNKPVSTSLKLELGDTLGDLLRSEEESPHDIAERNQINEFVRNALSSLTQKESYCIRRLHGIDCGAVPISYVASEYCVSCNAVTETRNRALAKLRKHLSRIDVFTAE